jgi:TnpA family transposase
MLEVSQAQRTIFVARYLPSRELQREITEGLNVVEAFNGANSVIYYGKGGEISSNRQGRAEDLVFTGISWRFRCRFVVVGRYRCR